MTAREIYEHTTAPEYVKETIKRAEHMRTE